MSNNQYDSEQEVRKLLGPVLICFAASIIEFSTASDKCHSNEGLKCSERHYAYAIACGVISALLCMIRLILALPKFRRELPSISLGNYNITTDMILAVILLAFWAAAASVLTKAKGIFQVSGNGYFSTWLAFFSALMYGAKAFSSGLQRFTEASRHHSKGVAIVLVASVVEFSVAAQDIDKESANKGRRHFAVAVGVISTVICLIQILTKQFRPEVLNQCGQGRFEQVLAGLLVVWWAIGAALNTSQKGSMTDTCDEANGYFATWIAFFGSVYVLASVTLVDNAGGDPYSEDREPALPYQQGPGAYQQSSGSESGGYQQTPGSYQQSDQQEPDFSYQSSTPPTKSDSDEKPSEPPF